MLRFSSIVIALAAFFTFGTQQGHGKTEHAPSDALAAGSAADHMPALAPFELAEVQVARVQSRGILPKKSGAHDLEFWNAIKDSTDPADYEAYLESFPEGSFAPLARLRIRQYSKAADEPQKKDEPGFEVDDMEMPYVARANANVRAEPTADSDKVGELSRGADVEVTGEA